MVPSIVNVGSVSFDTTRTPFKTVSGVLGGSGIYFSLSSSFFEKTGLVAVIGDDFPQRYMELLRQRIDIKGIEVKKGKTFRFDSSFGYDLGARTTNKTELNVFGDWIPKVPEEYRDIDFLYLGNVSPQQQLMVLDQVSEPKLTIADTIEFWIKNTRQELIEVISRVDGILLNDQEIRQLCQTPNIIHGAKTILDWGARFVLVKKGEHGSILFTHDMIFPTCGYPLEDIVDPTGAGDSFAGGFLGHIARNKRADSKTIREAVIYGNVMGSFVVEQFSIERLQNLSLKEVEERYEKYRKMILF